MAYVAGPIMSPMLPQQIPMCSSSTSYTPQQPLATDTWGYYIEREKGQDYFKKLAENLHAAALAGQVIYPPEHLIFNAFYLTPLDKVKVVILGLDPYPNDKAMGLSFSVPIGVQCPRSLQNMYKELQETIFGFVNPGTGYLEKWTQEGVLLLNSILTVGRKQGETISHSQYGWKQFTDSMIKVISDNCTDVVFLLMGNYAQTKARFIDITKHHVIKTGHPSPLAFNAFTPFNGSKNSKFVEIETKRLKIQKILFEFKHPIFHNISQYAKLMEYPDLNVRLQIGSRV